MFRFILDQIRKAPGPLKQPRILVADIAEELLDLAQDLIQSTRPGKQTADYPCCGGPPTPRPDSRPAAPPVAPSPQEEAKTKNSHVPNNTEPEDKSVLDPAPSPGDEELIVQNASRTIAPRLATALRHDANMKKQAFKVLAILWDADQKRLGPLSAKALSMHGENIQLTIRHENVRKVIRMRLENYVNIHAQGVGNGTVYRYDLSDEGRAHFESAYLTQESDHRE